MELYFRPVSPEEGWAPPSGSPPRSRGSSLGAPAGKARAARGLDIWVTFPTLHIEQKFITFGESLSNLCDRIQNGAIKTKNIFLHNFLGRVRI